MLRVRVRGDGWAGGPSLNTFYFVTAPEDAATAAGLLARVRAALFAAKGIYPTTVTHDVLPDVDVITPSTGAITNTISVSPAPAQVPGGAAAPFLPLACAIVLNLGTADFIAGRRVRGRAFISPINSGGLDSNGTPTAEYLSTVEGLGVNLRDATDGFGSLAVWHRPKLGAGGSTAIVTGSSVKDTYAVLRSRRD